MLRNAYGVLKGVPSAGTTVTPGQKRRGGEEAVRALQRARPHQRRRPQRQPRRPRPVPRAEGRRRADRAGERRPQLRARRHRARRSPSGSTTCPARTAAAGRPASATTGSASGRSSCSSTAACSTAPPTCASRGRRATTYQVTEDDYRGLLFIKPEQLKMVVEEAAQAEVAGDRPHRRRGGDGRAARRLRVRRTASTPIKDLRFCITHANFPSQHNLERCKELGVVRRRAAGVAVQGRRRRC